MPREVPFLPPFLRLRIRIVPVPERHTIAAWSIILHAVRIGVLVPRLLPREIVTGGRSLQCSAFQGWSPGTRMDSLIPGCVEYKSRSKFRQKSYKSVEFLRIPLQLQRVVFHGAS